MKKILITGGTGYIGSHTVLALLEKNYNVIIVDSLIKPNNLAITDKTPAKIIALIAFLPVLLPPKKEMNESNILSIVGHLILIQRKRILNQKIHVFSYHIF